MTMISEKERLVIGAPIRVWRPRLQGSLVAVGPSFAITLLFIYGFIGWTAYISFSASKMTPNAKLVGLANYHKLWQFDSWIVSVSNLFIFTVLYVGIAMAVGLGLAILLDQRVRAEGFFRTIFLYPAALSLVVTGVVWKWLLNPGTGIEALAHDVGLAGFKFDWIINESTVLYAVVIAAVWQVAGFSMAIFLSGLRGVNDEVIKAARLDGASTLRLYWHVIIPAIRSSFVTVFVLLTAFALKTFDLVVAMTAEGPGYASSFPATFMYEMSFARNQLGVGAASAMALLVFSLILVSPYVLMGGKRDSNA